MQLTARCGTLLNRNLPGAAVVAFLSKLPGTKAFWLSFSRHCKLYAMFYSSTGNDLSMTIESVESTNPTRNAIVPLVDGHVVVSSPATVVLR